MHILIIILTHPNKIVEKYVIKHCDKYTYIILNTFENNIRSSKLIPEINPSI